MSRKFTFLLLIASVTWASCKKDGYLPMSDALAEVPITVVAPYAFKPNPTVLASKAANKISFTLQIPESNPRSIKEVTKFAAMPAGNFSVIRDSANVRVGYLWSNTVIPVNAKSYTFNTTFDEYKAKTGISTAITSNALLARDFYFQIKLDNNQVIYPTSVKVWAVD